MKVFDWLKRWIAYRRDCAWYRDYVTSGGEVFIIFARGLVRKTCMKYFAEELQRIYPDLITEVQITGSSAKVTFRSATDERVLFTGEFMECSIWPVEYSDDGLCSEKHGANIYNDGVVCFSNHWAKFVFSDPYVVLSNNFLLECAIVTKKRAIDYEAMAKEHFKELGIDFDELKKKYSQEQ